MKRLLTLVLAALMMVGLCATALGQGDASLQAIQDKGVFVLGLDDSFPPMGFRDADNNIVGFDIDVATQVCARLGVELKLQPIEWASKEMELSGGNIDCIWNGMTITQERLDAMSISIPYLKNEQALIVLEGSDVQSKADLAGKTVGLQAGSSAEGALEGDAEFAASLAEAAKFEDNLTAMLDLDNGGVDAVLMDSVVAGYMMSQKAGSYRLLEDALAAEEYGIGFRKEDVALTEAVNAALLEMDADGTLAEIATKWFASDITTVKDAR